MKILLIVTTVIEGSVGLGLFLIPAFIVGTLLNSPIDTPTGLVAARLAGAALLALAACCWQARNSDRSGAALGIVAAMFFFNLAAAAILVYAGIRLGLQSPFIWPLIIMHAAMALWCGATSWLAMRKMASSTAEGHS